MSARRWLAPLACLALSGPGPAGACEGLDVVSAWIREPPPGATAAAAYATLRNNGSDPLRIDRVSASGFGMAMLHETVREGDRVRMRHREHLTVPAGGELVLAPGGIHIMLMQPAVALRAGDERVLSFGCGSAEREVPMPVRADAP